MKLFILTNSAFTGDNNQLLGIAKAFAMPCEQNFIPENEFNVSMLNDDDQVLVAGDHGIQIARHIKRARPMVHVTWSGHLVFQDFSTIEKIHWPDIIALPGSVVTGHFIEKLPQQCTLVRTDGVAHNVDDATLVEALETFKQPLPSLDFINCIGIIIAGDAPAADKTIQCFDQTDALKQAKLIAQFIKKNVMDLEHTALMITNGPRTGKHDPITKKPLVPDPHRSGISDVVSDTFVNELKQQFPGKVIFYDFQFGQTSAYQPMMHRVCQAEMALWFVPAESSSMVTESSLLSEKNIPVIVYTPASANENHITLVADAKQNGLISMIEHLEPTGQGKQVVRLAANQIADAMTQRVKAEILPQTLTVPKNPFGTVSSRRNPCYGFAVVSYLEQNFPEVNAFLMATRDEIIMIVDPDRTLENCPRRLPGLIKTKSLHASFYGSTPFIHQRDYADFFQSKARGLDNGAILKTIKEKLTSYLRTQKPRLLPVGLEFKEEDGTVLARYRVETLDKDKRPLASLKRALDAGQLSTVPVWDPNPLRDTTVVIVLCDAAVKDEPSKVDSIKAALSVANEGFKAFGAQSIDNYTIIKKYDKRTLTRGKHIEIFAEIHKPDEIASHQNNRNFPDTPS